MNDIVTTHLTADELETLILDFLLGLTLCDHMGDVLNAQSSVMERLGIDNSEWETSAELHDFLNKHLPEDAS